MMITSEQQRDSYVDFLRALGLFLLIGVHVAAPEWYVKMRSFDVPLMVVVSAICYRPLSGGYLSYAWKRFKRIYVPVALFLTVFFGGGYLLDMQYVNIVNIIGSYLLLDWPSIGYVWVMRVFLIMALIIPMLERILSKLPYWAFIAIVAVIIALQQILIPMVDAIPNRYVSYALYETLLFAIGYSALAAVGLRLAKLNKRQLIIIATVSCTAIVLYVIIESSFNPQQSKYPPHSLYLIYGIFASAILMLAKPFLISTVRCGFVEYLSHNSMWIYLWHIIPVYAMERWMDTDGMWLARYLIVVITAILLTRLYLILIRPLPISIRSLIN